MRHRKRNAKLGRAMGHRRALVGALVCGLIQEKRIRTTLPKARVARSLAERLVTLARRGTVAARRRIRASIRRADCVRRLFDEVTPHLQGRNGGYTRIVKLGRRYSDNSEMALLEWVGVAAPDKRKKKSKDEESKGKPSK
ncbi:MAG: 50S ribosomal protein L17 [Verrucomicrobiota bacterium]|nr:50S ribosomal protein L17 [Verrucomicrobiota bacterium]